MTDQRNAADDPRPCGRRQLIRLISQLRSNPQNPLPGLRTETLGVPVIPQRPGNRTLVHMGKPGYIIDRDHLQIRCFFTAQPFVH